MADRYVYSGAAGAGTGADWANAHTTLSAAITASTAGDVFYVAHDHSTNYGVNTTLAFKGTSAAPDRVLCVNRAGSVPPVAADLTTGAVEGTNAASTSLTITGNLYTYGMRYAPGSGQSTTCNYSSGAGRQHYESCVFSLLSTGTSSRIILCVSSGGSASYENCQLRYASTSQETQGGNGPIYWRGPSASSILASGSSIPGRLFTHTNVSDVTFDGADLSAISGTLIGSATLPVPARIINCKLHASVTTAQTPSGSPAPGIDLIGCHSTTNVARAERWQYQGTLTTETTIKRTGGASDGVTSYSWKIVPTANNKRDFPFVTFEGMIWNDTTGSSKTLTVHIVTDNVTLTDAQIWLEVEYLGSSATPLSTLVSDAPATTLTTGANQTSSSETWTTTGLGTPLKQKLDVTFTPQMAGPIRWRVKYAKTTTTVYVCPKAELS